MGKKSVTILGLPGSGKTTFIASFCIATRQDYNARMIIRRLPDDTRYIDDAISKLNSLTPMPHTPDSTYTPIELELTDNITSENFVLKIPDVSGEEFDAQWEHRLISSALKEDVATCHGVLLFAHCSVLRTPTIAQREKVIGQVPTQARDQSGNYQARLAPIEVKLVEVVQQVLRLRDTTDILRIGVVASAWDKEHALGSNGRSPSDWLRQELPLLWQYLESNSQYLTIRVFGVSAQGGDYETAMETLAKQSPYERARVWTDEEESHDITSPLRWVADL